MIDQRPTAKGAFLGLSLIIFLGFGNGIKAQGGDALFKANCAQCHSVTKKLTGPALAGFTSRGPWADKKNVYDWIHNPASFIKKDEYTASLLKEYNGTLMTAFPQLTTQQIDAIVEYISAEEQKAKGPVGGPPPEPVKPEDNSVLYGILTLILAVIALILLQVNSNLKKLADDKEGVTAEEPIPFYRNKTYIMLATLVLFVVGGYYVVKGGISLGRTRNYQPEQPIYFSHKVHAGTNQINCLFCHGGAFEGKHANIPSVNICMNCHMTINEYTGEKIVMEDGSELDGTAEIKKLYEFVGWDPAKAQFVRPGKPIQWIKIHNLPDHVYFNHSQHTRAGKVQCQTCHGEINTMNEVYQFAELSMGWCINCHRESKVDFLDSAGTRGNRFYSIYEMYHNQIKNKQRDSVTVSDIGGTECMKCHY